MILVCRRMLAGAAIILVLCLSYGESVNILEQEPTSNSSWTMNVSSTYSLSISSIVLLYEKLFESLQLGSAVNISDQCANATHLLVQAVRAEESWALRMIDALGKPSSGILQGSVVFLGYYSECVKTTAILPVDGKSSIPFRGKYCLPTLSFGASTSTLPKGILGPSYNVLRSNNPKIGLCVPSTCFMEDVSLAFNKER
ncbi:uncharacterized protein LOC111087620 [Limulus polyphemus]|uniref:Uncharacterized protein LOC111087620 n=1 Tax=Limulus polyphemus TaxID=6850 RepID=A0ABM1T3Z8_LIMPO|nr:uncharacterized protein LOC111087620 [Limulus polyphemus]